jgi:hypothetical protein
MKARMWFANKSGCADFTSPVCPRANVMAPPVLFATTLSRDEAFAACKDTNVQIGNPAVEGGSPRTAGALVKQPPLRGDEL